MAMLPEEFPVVLTVFMALGAWRMSQRHVLTRRSAVIETLGSATVICVDKTGTLTMNALTVRELQVDGARHLLDGLPLPEHFHELVEFAVLASPVDPFDPMDRAFRDLGEAYLGGTDHLHANWDLVREYPLSEHLLALSHVWRSPDLARLRDRGQGRTRGDRRPLSSRRRPDGRAHRAGRGGDCRRASGPGGGASPLRRHATCCRPSNTSSSSSTSASSGCRTRSAPGLPTPWRSAPAPVFGS